MFDISSITATNKYISYRINWNNRPRITFNVDLDLAEVLMTV